MKYREFRGRSHAVVGMAVAGLLMACGPAEEAGAPEIDLDGPAAEEAGGGFDDWFDFDDDFDAYDPCFANRDFFADLSPQDVVPSFPLGGPWDDVYGKSALQLRVRQDGCGTSALPRARLRLNLCGLQDVQQLDVSQLSIHQGAIGLQNNRASIEGIFQANTPRTVRVVDGCAGVAIRAKAGYGMNLHEQIGKISQDPSQFYYQVGTTAYPGGFARGQLYKD